MKKIVLLLFLFLLLCGCGKNPPAETTAALPVTTTDCLLPVTTAPAETLGDDIAVEPVVTEAIEALPAPAENAIVTAHPVGGNPEFYVFEEGLSYYVRFYGDPYSLSVVSCTKCTLSLPEDCTNGRIVDGSGGAGSGEVILCVEALHGEKPVHLDYLFYCDNITVPVFVWEEAHTPIHP